MFYLSFSIPVKANVYLMSTQHLCPVTVAPQWVDGIGRLIFSQDYVEMST